jgi:class 3 adenylate cyclase
VSSTSSEKSSLPPAVAAASPKSTSAATKKKIPFLTRVGCRTAGVMVNLIRRAVIIAASLYVLGCVALFSLPLFRPEALRKLATEIGWLHGAIDPALAFLNGLFSFRLTFMNFDFMLLGIALAAWLLQLGVAGRLEWLETQIYKPLKQTTATGVDQVRSAAAVPQGSRMSLLRDFAASKQLLSQAKKRLAFLSIDVVGSTKMKVGEDQLSIEHAFSEYKKFLERIFRDCRCWKVAWTPDGVMTCFLTVDEAATAGRRVLAELDWFNRDVHQLRSQFHVRCGLNAGEVIFPDEKSMEEISDEVIDVAGHMQKYADPDTLWVSSEIFQQLQDRSGFVSVDRQVDKREVFAWGKSPAPS